MINPAISKAGSVDCLKVAEKLEAGPPPPQCATGSETLCFPASLAQEAFWFLDQLEPGNPALNVAVRFHLAGKLDVELLERAFNELIRRHEILRTGIVDCGGKLTQLVRPSAQLKLSVDDLSGLSEHERGTEKERQATLEASRPFVLSQAPLIRANLLRLGPEEHMLHVTMHHAVSDGWSVGVLTAELSSIYEAFANGKTCPLSELPIQFADFTVWQKEFLGSAEIARQLQYWKDRLAGVLETNLPTDRPRPRIKRWQGDIVSILLPETLAADLQRVGQRCGATLFMVFLAAFKVLLLRYTGQTDIALGCPVVGRTQVETEKLIGVFINTVVLRTDLSENPSFLQALRSVVDTVIGAMANQDVPFETLVKELHPSRDLSRNPLFQVNFIHQRDFVKPVQFAGLKLTAIPSRSPGAIFDLQFFMVERDGIWRASCEYNTELFRRETVLRMLGHFQQLLTQFAANPDTPIEYADLLTPSERRQLLGEWNCTARAFPREKTIHQLFEEQVRRCRTKTALSFRNQTLTYEALDQAAEKISSRLLAAGVQPGSLVGLYLERSPDMVAALLGILKAGAAYVPMDPVYPAERLDCMIRDANLRVIVTHSALAASLPQHQATLLALDADSAAYGSCDRVESPNAESPAYVIFTSGSTGRPKGVQIPHRSVINFLNAMRRTPGISEDDILLSITTLSFDIAGLELFLPLTSGATVVLATREMVSDGQLLRGELEKKKATILQGTLATWRMLLESGWKGNPRLKGLIGGEAVPRELVNKLAPLCHSLWNMYGPTETTIWSTVGRLEPGEGSVSIGRPIDNTEIYVVSEKMQLQPIGVAGELLIGGEGLAIGYLNQPELTRQKFIQDCFSDKPERRLYRTGDLVRWHSDGTLECLQRIDHQVKLRGFRIELGEIESVLATHPEVRQTVVVAREDVPGDKRLVAYVVPGEGKHPDTAVLRDHLRKTLPEYMVPSAFVTLPELPLVPSGKVDRKALPKPSATPLQVSVKAVSPRNETEHRLLAIFSKVLQTEVPSINDSFFDLGGHSLLAVSLMDQIKREFDIRVPVATLFSASTVATLADNLKGMTLESKHWDSLVPIRQNNGKPVLFLIHGAGGNLLLYRELAQELGPEVSVYGFQSVGLDHQSQPLTVIEDMAARYVQELRAFQPDGPYHLAGYCMGGAVAYEMARQLSADGHFVGLTALLDTYNLCTVKRGRGGYGELARLSQRVGFHFANLVRLGPLELRGYLSEKFRMGAEMVSSGVSGYWNRLKGGQSVSSGDWRYIERLNHEASWAYVPQATDVPVTVFRPKNNYDYFSDPHMGWSGYVRGSPEIVELPCNPHAMLIPPFVRSLAKELKARIASFPERL